MKKRVAKATVLKFLKLTGELDNSMEIRKRESETEFMEGAKAIYQHLLSTHGTFEGAVEARIKENEKALNKLKQLLDKNIQS